MEESCHCALISSFGISLAFFSSFPLSIFSLLSGSGPNSWIHQLFGRRVVHVTFSSVTCFHWVGLITLKIEMMWGQVFNKVLFSFREKRTKKSRQNDHLDGIGPIKLMRCGRQTTNDKRQSLGFWLCSVWSSSFMLQRWKISLKKKNLELPSQSIFDQRFNNFKMKPVKGIRICQKRAQPSWAFSWLKPLIGVFHRFLE